MYKKGYYKDPYIVGFLKDNFLRPSCYNCQYANTNRISDITIGDFWGYKSTSKKDKNDDKGISLVIINSKKGNEYFEHCKKNLVYFSRNLDEAVKGNKCLSESFQKPVTREAFWEDYVKLSFEQIIEKYMRHDKITFTQFVWSNFSYKYARLILLPYIVLSKIKRIISK